MLFGLFSPFAPREADALDPQDQEAIEAIFGKYSDEQVMQFCMVIARNKQLAFHEAAEQKRKEREEEDAASKLTRYEKHGEEAVEKLREHGLLGSHTAAFKLFQKNSVVKERRVVMNDYYTATLRFPTTQVDYIDRERGLINPGANSFERKDYYLLDLNDEVQVFAQVTKREYGDTQTQDKGAVVCNVYWTIFDRLTA